jgi:D-sedoheptulose 7-phosphate isomerase
MTQEKKILDMLTLADQSCLIRKAMVRDFGGRILETANRISAVLGAGGKLLIAGNGGSASMASHFAAEMVVRLTSDRNRQALPAIALSADISVITACGNDYGFDSIFARQVEALGNRGDMLLVMSTSGNSENLVRAVNVALERNLIVTALLGADGGKIAKMLDRPLIVPHPSTQRIQEEHLFLIHTIVELVERDLFA